MYVLDIEIYNNYHSIILVFKIKHTFFSNLLFIRFDNPTAMLIFLFTVCLPVPTERTLLENCVLLLANKGSLKLF